MIDMLLRGTGAAWCLEWNLVGEPPRRGISAAPGDPDCHAMMAMGLVVMGDHGRYLATDQGVEVARAEADRRRRAEGIVPWHVTWVEGTASARLHAEAVVWARTPREARQQAMWQRRRRHGYVGPLRAEHVRAVRV